MNHYVITAVNPLTEEREVVSLPMTREEAIKALRAEKKRAGQRTLTMLRIKHYDSNQTYLKFQKAK